MGENNRTELVGWRVKPVEDEGTGAVRLLVWGRGAGIDVAAVPLRTVEAVPDGFEAEAEDGSIFLLLMREGARPALFGTEKAEWYRLVHRLASFELECFACMWRDFFYLCPPEEEEGYVRRECEEWAARNGLDTGRWERIHQIKLAMSGDCESCYPAWKVWNKEDGLRIDLSAFIPSYYRGCHEARPRDGYLETEYSSRRVEQGKKPLVSVRLKWKDWASPKGAVFQLNYRIQSENCLEILEAKLSPFVRPRWESYINDEEVENSGFRFHLWDHVYLYNAGETPLRLTGGVLDEILEPGGLREIEVLFCS